MAVLTWSTGWEATSVALWSPVHAIEDDVVVAAVGPDREPGERPSPQPGPGPSLGLDAWTPEANRPRGTSVDVEED